MHVEDQILEERSMKTCSGLALWALVGTLAGAANAGTVTARYTGTCAQAVDVTLTPTINGNLTTVTFNWVRTDVAGPGVDSTVECSFIACCCELGQYVSPNTSTSTPCGLPLSTDSPRIRRCSWVARGLASRPA